MNTRQLPVPPFEYDDFRLFLHDLTAQWKKDHRKWSFAVFARRVGFAAPNYLKQIVEGKRPLSRKAALKVVDYFHFNREETEYFLALVDFNQAKSDNVRDDALKRMRACRKLSGDTKQAVDYHRFYSEWYNSVIREMVTVSRFQDDPEWVGAHLCPPISAREAERAVRFLKNSGNLIEAEGTLRQAEPVHSTGPEIASLAVANYHKGMMDLARDAIDRLPGEQRNISSLTMALSKEAYDRIVKEIYEFQDKIITMAMEGTSPDDVYQLNFQFFPTTKTEEEHCE